MSNVYHVTLQHEECLHTCSLCCPDCNVCVHMYTCTYPDSLIRATICKHIHLIAKYVSQKSSSNKPNDKHLLENLRNESKDQIDSLKWQVHTKALGLAAQVHLINNIDVLKSVISYIRSASNLTKMDKEMHTLPLLPSNNTEPSTKHIKPQRPFFSTKRRRKATVRIAKPTVQEKEHICKILLNDNVYSLIS